MNKTDDELLGELKSGCKIAYQVLFKKYYRLLLTHAFYFLQDDMEAEDVVQNIFIEIWDKKLYNSITSSLKNYLLRMVRNRCLTEIAKKGRIKRDFDNYIIKHDFVIYDKSLELKEENNFVNKILKELPSQRSQAFSMVYLEDMKYKDAAEAMGISVNSVKTHLKLALKNLKSRFKKNE